MDTVFGLPTHPLAVHAPVVLLPLVAVVTVVLAVHERWRGRVGWWLAAAVAVVLALLLVARQSGIELNDAFAGAVDMSTHQRLANQTVLLSTLWLALVVAVVALDRARRAAPGPSLSAATGTDTTDTALLVGTRVAAGLMAVVAVVATIWLVRTGHEGAYPTWRPTVDLYFE